MTDEEKAAAAKAEAEKKAAIKSKETIETVETDDEEEDTDENEAEDDKGETLESLKARLKKVNESDKKRRLKNKELELELAKHQKLSDQEQAVQKAQKEANAKNARILLKGELASVAKDVHDPAALFRAFGDRFSDIDVDLENETVDRDALKEKLEDIRKEAPYFFKSDKTEPLDDDEGDGKTKVIIKKNPDKGRQGGGGSEYKEWMKLKESGAKKEAQAFYAKNRDKILMQLGK